MDFRLTFQGAQIVIATRTSGAHVALFNNRAREKPGLLRHATLFPVPPCKPVALAAKKSTTVVVFEPDGLFRWSGAQLPIAAKVDGFDDSEQHMMPRDIRDYRWRQRFYLSRATLIFLSTFCLARSPPSGVDAQCGSRCSRCLQYGCDQGSRRVMLVLSLTRSRL